MLNSNRETAGNLETEDFASSAREMHYGDPSVINRFRARTSSKHSQASSSGSKHCHPLQLENYDPDGSGCGLVGQSSLNRAGEVVELGQNNNNNNNNNNTEAFLKVPIRHSE